MLPYLDSLWLLTLQQCALIILYIKIRGGNSHFGYVYVFGLMYAK